MPCRRGPRHSFQACEQTTPGWSLSKHLGSDCPSLLASSLNRFTFISVHTVQTCIPHHPSERRGSERLVLSGATALRNLLMSLTSLFLPTTCAILQIACPIGLQSFPRSLGQISNCFGPLDDSCATTSGGSRFKPLCQARQRPKNHFATLLPQDKPETFSLLSLQYSVPSTS